MARPKSEVSKVPTDWYAEPELLEEIERIRLSRFPVPTLTAMISEIVYNGLFGMSGRRAQGNGKQES